MIVKLKQNKIYATLPENFENYKKFWLADETYNCYQSGSFSMEFGVDIKSADVFLVLDKTVLKTKIQSKIGKTKIFLKLLHNQNVFWVLDEGFEMV